MDNKIKNQTRNHTAETDGVDLRGIMISLAIVVVLVAVTFMTVKGIFHVLNHHAREADLQQTMKVRADIADSRNYFPQPREQVTPREDLQAWRAREQSQLNTYGWVDRSAGIARIPIEQAMDLINERGLPARSGTNAGIAGPSSLQLEQARGISTNAINQSLRP